MGQRLASRLSEPVTIFRSGCCRNSKYRVGSSCMQGWRINMEDCHVHILSLPDDPDAAFFAVYDGHGGAHMAQYAEKYLHEFITSQPAYKEGNIEEAMKKGFLEFDKIMQANEILKNVQAGTTAIAILIKDNVLYSANAGDSKAVACIAGVAVPLSYEHKPMLEEEKRRIVAAGGWVEFNRVNGQLALSRALGDFMFKKNYSKKPEEQIVSALPDVQRHEITEDWEFVVLASDGIWEVMNSKKVVKFIRRRFTTAAIDSSRDKGLLWPMLPEEICEQLISRCLASHAFMRTGCDNMTVILIGFLHRKPLVQKLCHCRESLANQVRRNTCSSTASMHQAHKRAYE